MGVSPSSRFLQPGQHRDEEQQSDRHLVKGFLQEPDSRQPSDDAGPIEGIGCRRHSMAEKGFDKCVDPDVAVVLVQVSVDQDLERGAIRPHR